MNMKLFKGLLFVCLLSVITFNVFSATYTVTNTNDSGAGSLRQAILDSNANIGLDTIDFSIPGSVPFTIQPTSALPNINDNWDSGTFIDAGTQDIIIDGTNAGAVTGLHISSDNNVISGLVINNFGGNGIFIDGCNNNLIVNNYIGTDVTGTVDLGNSLHGVCITNGAQSNTIGGIIAGTQNIISGNDQNGVYLSGSGTDNNVILGNHIGTDVTGTVDLGNSSHGVYIGNGASFNTVGGTTSSARNIISGNNSHGILITNSGTDNNVVLGNFIGTDVTGTVDLGNSNDGVYLTSDAQGNTIGGTVAGARNIISGNNNIGVLISNSDNNTVLGNYIGTDVTGTIDIANTNEGIAIWGGAQSNTVGGIVAGARNIISGNNTSGVVIWNSGTINNVILGNYIGTDVNGTSDLGNSVYGIQIGNGAQSNTIGGTIAGAMNLISGNDDRGIYIINSGTDNNVIIGNYIGTNVNGTGAIGNTNQGIFITNGPQSNIIGGTTAGERNIISGNFGGILISSSDNNVVIGNYIGTDVNGTSDLGNNSHGVIITNSAQGNTIGGTIAGSGNVISGNNDSGIFLTGSATNNTIIGNYIGTDCNGTADLGNSEHGIEIAGSAQSNTIGGTVAGARNIISGNNQYGVYIYNIGTDNNVILGNYIGTDVTGTVDLGNTWAGVELYIGPKSNIIGGTVLGARNIISGNLGGINIYGNGTDNNVVIGNYIGTDVNGTADLGNSNYGVHILENAKSNIIGGTEIGSGNVLSGNNGNGVIISGTNSTDNQVLGNYIGTTADGTGNLGNSQNGVYIYGGAHSNTVGGTISGMANIIAFNGWDGVYIQDNTTDNNRISGNSIFSNTGLGIDLGTDGVTLNDANDTDTGPNELLNFPVLELYSEDGADYLVTGTATPNAEVELYIVNNSTAAVNPDPSGYGEGYQYLETVNVDGTGLFTSSTIELEDGTGISAIAIDGNGNTSEFGYNIFTSSAIFVSAVTVAPTDMASEFTKVGTQDLLMERLVISTNDDTAAWTSISFDITGTCVDSDISGAKVYLDNGDGQFSSDNDTLIGTGTLTSKHTDIDITDQVIETTAKTYFLCLDIAPEAQNGITVGIRCEDNSYFTIDSPDTVSTTNFPFESGQTTIKSFEDSLENLKVYPNPWKPNLGVEYIVFEKLTENVKIKIYTITGELVIESNADGQSEWNWDLKNKDGKKIASGLYIYIISNDKGEKKQGKVAIIR